jgi:hypothetical protein
MKIHLCFIIIAVALFFIWATDIYCVADASEIRRTMRGLCLIIIFMMFGSFMEVEGKLFLEAEQQRAAVAQARLVAVTARNASYHQACLLLAVGQQAPRNARDAYHQALGFAFIRRAYY